MRKKALLMIRKVILSIDVGVKNLALSLISKDVGDTIRILYWKWYDITETSFTAPVPKKGKKKEKGSLNGTCSNILKSTNKVCGKQGTLNSRGRAYCGVHDPARKKKSNDIQDLVFAMQGTLKRVGEDIAPLLDAVVWQNGVKDFTVVIEQQSSNSLSIMMQSNVIFSFFVAHFNNTVPVKFVPAYNKLSVYDGPEIVCTLKTPYAIRKYLSKKHTDYYLTQWVALAQWRSFFDSCKSKQDDISDAFLQGLYILNGKGKGVAENTGEVRKRRRRKF